MMGRRKLALALAATLVALPAQAATIQAVTVEPAGANVRVTVKLSGRFDAPAAFALDAPQRLVIDLPGSRSSNRNVGGQGAVKAARAAQFSDQVARVVLDLSAPMTLGDAVANAADSTLVVTLKPADADAFKTLVARGRTKLPSTSESQLKTRTELVGQSPARSIGPAHVQVASVTPPSARMTTRPRGSFRPLVVIDAGHGGRDIGAISAYEARREKDATLAIAKTIKRALEAEGDVRVLLTRDDDRFIPLRQRVEIARAAKADLFISVHADSAPQPEARGATVYTLSEVASDREAARLAAKENKSDIIAGLSFAAESPDVADILIDLAQRETMNTSAAFAATLRREMSPEVHFKGNAHRFAGFIVLKAADVPSILLETGYLSNTEDAKFLFSAAGQRAIAEGVRRAVDAHFLRRVAQR